MKFGIQIYFFISCVTSFVATLTWHNCGNTSHPIQISSLEAHSNKTNILYLNGNVSVVTNITSPVKGVFDMQRRFFWGWTKIPCVDHVGSCTYEDVCQLSPYINKPCPSDSFPDDLPCRCPIPEGEYKLDDFPISLGLLPRWAHNGKYRVKVSLNHKKTELMCLLIYIEL